MFLSVREILDGDSFEGSRLLAGERGLSRPVGSVTVGEVPDIADWLTGKELVLSTFFAVSKNREKRYRFAKKIIESQAAAMIVKSKRFVEEIDPEILDLAQENGFPIVEVQPQVRWTDLIQEVSKRIIGRSLANLERSEKIHNELLKIVVEGKGWSSIAKTAARLIKRPVIIEDEFYQTLADSLSGKKIVEAIEEVKDRRIENLESTKALLDKIEKERYIRIGLSKEGLPAKIVVPIIVGWDILGYVSTFEIDERVNDLDIAALQSTATVAALEMGRERVKFETESRLYGDLLEDLFSRSSGSESEAIARVKQFGVDLSGGVISVFIEPDRFEDGGGEMSGDSNIFNFRQKLFEFLQVFVKSEIDNAIFSVKRDGVMIVISPQPSWVTEEVSSRVLQLALKMKKSCWERFSQCTFSAGIGRLHGNVGEISNACEESSVSLDIGRKLNGLGGITQFNDIGAYKIIYDLFVTNPSRVSDFFRETVEPLAAYDKRHNSDLVLTLTAFFDNDESVSRTSGKIFVHPKTIGYRLQRIKEISNLDVGRYEDKEKLSVGLKAGKLMGLIEK